MFRYNAAFRYVSKLYRIRIAPRNSWVLHGYTRVRTLNVPIDDKYLTSVSDVDRELSKKNKAGPLHFNR